MNSQVPTQCLGAKFLIAPLAIWLKRTNDYQLQIEPIQLLSPSPLVHPNYVSHSDVIFRIMVGERHIPQVNHVNKSNVFINWIQFYYGSLIQQYTQTFQE